MTILKEIIVYEDMLQYAMCVEEGGKLIYISI